MLRRGVVLLLVLLTSGCDQISRLQKAIVAESPYDAYVRSLRKAGIDRTPLGIQWIAAGRRALSDAPTIELPHRAAETIHADVPSAIAYRFQLQRGRVYRLDIHPATSVRIKAFADVFRMHEGRDPERVAGIGPPQRQLEFEPDDAGTYAVRVQAEFLGSGSVAIAQRHRPALLFPVSGRGRANVQSFFGAARGGREHQGIDIFAPRGTPAVAATDGFVTSTSPNALGGNVVWLWDPRRNQTLYYAHLDTQAVSRGQWVRRGDVIGFVGNTGNARTTAPHLHFGIYRRGQGAIDPLYYVVDPRS
jgi:murein DD-endopeptidase MepM/ murein hydrolase activator NlpD